MRKGSRLASVAIAVGLVVVAAVIDRAATRELRAQKQAEGVPVAQDAPAPALPEALKAAPEGPFQSPPPVADQPAKASGDLLPAPPESPQPTAAPEPTPSEDPEQVAKAYVEKTRREAEAAIKTLREEQNTLRERLKKVEAALQRWEALKAAVDPDPFSQVKQGKFQPIQTTIVEGGINRTTEAGSNLEPAPASPQPPRLEPVGPPTAPPPVEPDRTEGPNR